MKKKYAFGIVLILFVTTVFLTACPFESDVPIDEPQVKIDQRLLGKWIIDYGYLDEDEYPDYVEIVKRNDYTYAISDSSYDSDEGKYMADEYIAHISMVGNASFVNLKPVDDNIYYIYRIYIGNNEFTLDAVTDNIDEYFGSSKDLKAFIQAYKDLSFFYNDSTDYIRLGS